MPTFDIVSEVNQHEVANAVDQANRDLGNRWDFKNVDASIEHEGNTLTLTAEQDFQLEQLVDIMRMALARREVDVRTLKEGDEFRSGKQMKRKFTIQEGIDTPTAKDIVKRIKGSGLKVQASIQGEKVRVTGKKRDDLQATMALLREAELDVPLQFDNFRD
ncbi:YajQ family cyclic di-GMP-binding protein [Hydrocarboniclastica marina]|uniref:Nucleotide-binding protein soil367_11020 n=1 Tax=Hydrocarboniclastica marina TaxID=2259620 RepID=A0A4P7XI72_9ALTE|nr:YajQ family cyclic di-GMP-binding protein [Hydrocarboniclastica marina]MAM00559.1 YajQ family cyclic di-GMP-binding protein [Alteromonadaceae bacterium]QCF26425.1 YajQ family cyclic di-GMP-binding protein [Hydrocarboniclastica marina]